MYHLITLYKTKTIDNANIAVAASPHVIDKP